MNVLWCSITGTALMKVRARARVCVCVCVCVCDSSEPKVWPRFLVLITRCFWRFLTRKPRVVKQNFTVCC